MNQVTEIEKVAVGMLSEHTGGLYDTEVVAWAQRIMADPDYSEFGHILNRHTNSDNYAGPDWSEIIPDRNRRRSARWTHDAIVSLGCSICIHRSEGRDEGERMTDIGFGLAVVGSLAADILDFHRTMINVYAAHSE